MSTVSHSIERLLPVAFGIGFLAPVIAQGAAAMSLTEPFGLSHTVVGLAIGGAWGIFAALLGRWI